MTQLFAADGSAVPVTAIEAGPCPVIQVRTEERDGYRAVQIGFGRKKARRSRKAELGHAGAAGLDYVPTIIREFTLGEGDVLAEDPHVPTAPPEVGGGAEGVETDGEAEDAGGSAAAGSGGAAVMAEKIEREARPEPQARGLRVGQVLTVAMFGEGERVKISGQTKGRGFQGVVKRHGFSGYPRSHGHPYSRVPGSVGPGTDPSRVIKGRRMAGRMGGVRRTERNLEVVKVDAERNLLFVKGSVPGARNGWVFIYKQ